MLFTSLCWAFVIILGAISLVLFCRYVLPWLIVLFALASIMYLGIQTFTAYQANRKIAEHKAAFAAEMAKLDFCYKHPEACEE